MPLGYLIESFIFRIRYCHRVNVGVPLLGHHYLMVHGWIVLHLIVHVFIHRIYLLLFLSKEDSEKNQCSKEYKEHSKEGLSHHCWIQRVSEVIMMGLPLLPRFFVVFIFSFLFLFRHFVWLPVLLILRLLLLLSIIEEIIEGLAPLLSPLFLFIHLSPELLLLLLVEFIQEIFIPTIERVKLSSILSSIISVPSSFLPLRWLFILAFLVLLLLVLLSLLLLLPGILRLLSEWASIIWVPILTSPRLLLLALLIISAHGVILWLLVFVPQDIISSSDLLELVWGFSLVFVWMVLLCQFVVGRFDVFLVGWWRHSQNFVVVFVGVEVWGLHSNEFPIEADETIWFEVFRAIKYVEQSWV